MFIGWTTPEGWPFALVVAIGSPGNEAVVPLTKQYHRVMKAACRWTEERHNTEATEGETAREPAPEPVATYLGRLPIFDPEAS
jgi:hypothetical protein